MNEEGVFLYGTQRLNEGDHGISAHLTTLAGYQSTLCSVPKVFFLKKVNISS